jgi:hypothetical protein
LSRSEWIVARWPRQRGAIERLVMDESAELLLVCVNEGATPKSAGNLLQNSTARPTIEKPVGPQDQSARGTLESARLRLDAARPSNDLEVKQIRNANAVDTALITQQFNRMRFAVVDEAGLLRGPIVAEGSEYLVAITFHGPPLMFAGKDQTKPRCRAVRLHRASNRRDLRFSLPQASADIAVHRLARIRLLAGLGGDYRISVTRPLDFDWRTACQSQQACPSRPAA